MKEVLTNYTTRLEKELGTVEIYSSNAKNRLLIDFQYYIQKLSLLDGIDGPGNRLEVVVNNITIKENKPTLEQKTIINEYIRQSFDSGSRRSSVFDESSSSYTNSPNITGKNEDSIIGTERLSNSPLIIGKNVLGENMDRLSLDNVSQDDLSLDSSNENLSINNMGNIGNNNEFPSSSLNQSVSINADDEPSTIQDQDQTNDHVTVETNLMIDTTTTINNKSNGGAVSAITSIENRSEGVLENIDNRPNSAPPAPDNSNAETSESSHIDQNSNSEEKNQTFKSPERKSSYTINKKTFSVFSQNVKKFGSEIKKHYSNNNSMESLFGLDKMVSKSNSLKSLTSNNDDLEDQSNNNQ